MSVKTMEGYSGPGVVSERLISRVIQVDRPLDGGGDYEIGGLGQAVPETVKFPAWQEGDPAATEAAANVAMVDAVVSSAIAETAQKVVSRGVSYAGEVPALPDGPEPGFTPFPTLP